MARRVLKKVYYGKPIYPEQITRGPCDEGYHIPTRQERLDLYNIGINIGAWTIPGQFANMLMLPPSGYFVSVDMVFGGTDTLGAYMTCTPGAEGKIYAYGFNYQDGTTVLDTQVYKTNGLVIRPFKNEGREPIFSSGGGNASGSAIKGLGGPGGGGDTDTNRTTLYGNSDTKIGVFYSQSGGLITISEDGINFVTIKDRNLGASSSWTPSSSVLSSTRGNVYQFGNNHGWSNPATDVVTYPYTTDKVDISSYGYRGYNSDLYVSNTFDRATTDSNRLWIPSTEPQFTEIKYIYAGGYLTYCYNDATLSQTFTYTGTDQHFTVPAPGRYTIKCRGAGSGSSAGGYAEGEFKLSPGTVLSIVCGSKGNNGGEYGFNGTSNYSADYNGGGLAGVFLGEDEVLDTDTERALIIGGGAGAAGRHGAGGVGGGETGGNGGAGGGCGGPGYGGSQTVKGGGAQRGGQFHGGGPSGTYGSGGGAGWYGGGGNTGDGSGWDDQSAGGGSGYVNPIALRSLLSAGQGSPAGQTGKVEISLSYYPGSDDYNTPPREFYYDFRGGSLQGFIDAGGDGIDTNGSYSITANGLQQTNGSTDRRECAWVELPDMTNAKTITITSLAYYIAGSWSNNKRVFIAYNRDFADRQDGIEGDIAFNTSSPGTYNSRGLSGFGENLSFVREAAATGETTMTLSIDLVSKNVIFENSGANTRTFTYTMTDEQLNRLLQCRRAGFEKERGYSDYNGEALKTVGITVTY